MRILWVTRSFLDYRIPVYRELKALSGGDFRLIFNSDYVPNTVVEKAQKTLGDSCIGLDGEFTIGYKDTTILNANAGLRIPFQPKLIKIIKSYKPHVIVSDGFFQWTYAALWMRLFYGVPHLMCYERTLHTERNAQWYRKFYRKFVSKWIDAICCSGTQCTEYVRSLNFKKPITQGHMVADVSFFLQEERKINLLDLHSNPKDIKYLYVGRIVDAKGISELLDAWNTFQKNKSVVLYLIGDGPQKCFYEKKCEGYKSENVYFLGKVEYDKLPAYYQSADLFIIPTLEDNWSLVVPEAMASGLPILSSIFNGCYPEYVTKNNGWIFNPLDRQNFIKKLNESYKNKNIKEMKKNSIKIIKNHTPKEAALNIYKTIDLICSN